MDVHPYNLPYIRGGINDTYFFEKLNKKTVCILQIAPTRLLSHKKFGKNRLFFLIKIVTMKV